MNQKTVIPEVRRAQALAWLRALLSGIHVLFSLFCGSRIVRFATYLCKSRDRAHLTSGMTTRGACVLLVTAVAIFIYNTPILAGPPSGPPPKFVLTLTQAQKIALKQHPEIIAAQYRTKAAQEGINEAKANYFPQVSGDAVGVGVKNKSNTRLAAINGLTNPVVYERGSIGVSANQLITDFGRTNNLVDSAKFGLQAHTARSLSIQDRVLFEVARTFYNVLRSQEVLRVTHETVHARDLLLEQIQFMYESKLKSLLDVSVAKQSYDDANLLVLRAQNELDDALAELSEALGYGEEKHFTLERHERKPKPVGLKIDQAIGIAKKQNPTLIALKAELSAAVSLYEAEVAVNYPTVKVIGYAGGSPLRKKSQLEPTFAAAGVHLGVPIYTGGRITANAKRAKYQADAVKQDLTEKENQIIRDVRVAWNNAQTAYQKIGVMEEYYKTSVEAEDLTQASYELGKSSIVDLEQAMLYRTQAQIAQVNAGYDYLIKRFHLDYFLGVGPGFQKQVGATSSQPKVEECGGLFSQDKDDVDDLRVTLYESSQSNPRS